MGYMGFGMRKEVYKRKPKTSFSKMKSIYGDHLEDFHKHNKENSQWSEIDKAAFKASIARKLRNKTIMIRILKLLAFIGIVSVIALALYSQWLQLFKM